MSPGDGRSHAPGDEREERGTGATIRLRDGDGLQVLDAPECMARISGRSPKIGRVAFAQGGYPVVLPVNYAVVDGEVVFRTGLGSKLEAALLGSPMSFQVDAVDEQWLEGWSVLIKGFAAELPGHALDRPALRALRPWGPGSKPRYIRVRADAISGRAIV